MNSKYTKSKEFSPTNSEICIEEIRPTDHFLDIDKTEWAYNKENRNGFLNHVSSSTSLDLSTQNVLVKKPKGNTFDLSNFLSKKSGPQVQKDKSLPKNVRSFYKKQDHLIKEFEDHIRFKNENLEDIVKKPNEESHDQCLAKVTFFINLCLMIIKSVAAALSGSLAIISSLVDSCVDLVSGIIIWYSNRASRKPNIYHYPQGRTRLEPIGLVILSSIMAIASFQIIFTSIGQMIKGDMHPKVDTATLIITLTTIVTKLILWIVLRRYKTPGAQVLTMDQRNDFFSNSVALVCAYIGFLYWRYADPIGALLIAIYIAMSWWLTGYKQIQYLTGHTAQSKFLQLITWICLNHSEKILKIDTVRAFHFGNNFLVEVDIMLPETMFLKEAHDIGEKLQVKLEGLPEIERAFVHLDYETEHRPSEEHKFP
ncbi:unnamed protein product [Gordionus sp. m RMFG-2023]|uniref:uncharacterized protein LOC135929557 n=1 Tax=Gordionus sp. m RMFG-2023 TaxID=3053472 RepID=UPI0030DE73DE